MAKVDGLRVTGLARTLIDVAPLAYPDELVAMMEQAQRMQIFDFRELRRLLRQ